MIELSKYILEALARDKDFNLYRATSKDGDAQILVRIPKGSLPNNWVAVAARSLRAARKVILTAQRIYQDLVEQNGFSDSHESVKRFVRQAASRET